MKVTRRLKITVTRHGVLHSSVASVQAFCPGCARLVETLACAHAAEVLEIDGQALAGLIAAGRVHTIALVSGDWRVCRESLFVQGR
jgi:hypothetical protein